VARGLIRESLSLITWLVAFWVAYTYASSVSIYFAKMVSAPALQTAAAFVALFVGSLVVLSIISFLLYRLMSVQGVSGTDRILGAFFGVARAVVIVAGFMLVAGVTSLPQEPWWRESMLAKQFTPVIALLRDLLPSDIARQLAVK
jgi:membrane protein required for colicin V production